MPTSNPDYTSFLLRLWREPPASVAPEAAGRQRFDAAHHEWLVQVEHIPGGEKEYFASLKELFGFIRAQLPGQHGSKGAGEQRCRGDKGRGRQGAS